jgi:hypothetical protein
LKIDLQSRNAVDGVFDLADSMADFTLALVCPPQILLDLFPCSRHAMGLGCGG